MIGAEKLCIGYEEKIIVNDFSFNAEKGEVISIIGPNGSGKSTLLKAISRFIKAKEGLVYFDKRDMSKMNIKDIAKEMASLSQYNRSPEDITVKELIYYGRVPHKKWYEKRNSEDEDIISWAIKETSLGGYENKKVSSLSGGERQRVWIAMALAQKPKILLLDEPTTYLDICHQLEVMELIRKLNKTLNLTVIMVLHDLGHAAKYSDKVIVIKRGNLVVEGSPEKVLTRELIKDVYNVDTCIRKDIIKGELMIYPIEVCKREEGREAYE
ncbi:iron compound ABC transporter, ATP-binding protein FhuC [Gottschalkia acidurici 9a]|uniref:Iron compound ABC transporter, ATP-binding protein FhuC n=1 Tax=Gottschalkia acidurici (strain ATCC 7906 / DSM 604 / BCRC 14475 / CIP 104303 / KCTC 5404 / NCIMB 10678 / 9a) TaxID=1128398 RepID=K0AYI3_GOTA9|nr:ABC transporter ATP-binding protein [Gottschalkia acidurici]AFS77446.1 iron compound ABC transporter, ATP-binding protein FhuC [Gottschalkia acidurici 9a]